MTIDISQFFQVFFDEAEELLAEMERLLLAVDIASPDPEDLNAVFRTAHSVKGGASTFGLNDMTEVTHVLESLLDRIRKGEMALTKEHVDAFLAAKDSLKMQLDGHRSGAHVRSLYSYEKHCFADHSTCAHATTGEYKQPHVRQLR